MPKTNTIEINGQQISVKELTLQQILDLSENSVKNPVDAMLDLLGKCADIDRDFILTCSPSELKPMIEAILEINSDFFDQAAAVGMNDAATHMEQMIRKIFIVAFLPSSAPDTVQ